MYAVKALFYHALKENARPSLNMKLREPKQLTAPSPLNTRVFSALASFPPYINPYQQIPLYINQIDAQYNTFRHLKITFLLLLLQGPSGSMGQPIMQIPKGSKSEM